MIKAAIDIGSNSVRMLVGEIKNGSIKVIGQYLRTTRLGKTAQGGSLNDEAVRRTLRVLAEFKTILKKYDIEKKPLVAATSAVREAADREQFKRMILDSLGWELQILSGAEEAAYSYRGAVSVVDAPAVVVDVGGGSTELICQSGGKIFAKSVPAGAVRLYNGEIEPNDLPQLLNPLKAIGQAAPQNAVLVGVGGTITSLAAIKSGLRVYCRSQINGVKFTRAEIAAYYNELKALTAAEILAKYPLLAEREDIICSGIKIYLELFELLGFGEIVVSDAGILDGLLLSV